jgi:glycerol-3-phosphate dehydrogenase (NAD(P)+)
MQRVAVIGSGSWGTAASGLAAVHADQVVIWCHSAQVAEGINQTRHNPRHLVDYQLPANVGATASMAEACAGVDAAILAVPSAFLRQTCAQLAPHLRQDVPVLVLTKGVEPGTGDLMADLVAQELGNADRVAVLSGPNHAEEICKGTVSAAVVASKNAQVAATFQALMVNPHFRVYVSDDVVGVEVCGAVKNVIAIACGVAVAGLGAGDNTLAVLMTRGLAEITRISTALGGRSLTCMGLAGMGDLVATCTSQHSRNRTFGEAFARGESLAQYEARTHMVVEGAVAALSVHELTHKLSVESPLVDGVHGILYEDMPLAAAVDVLLGRLPREEFYGLTKNE